MAWTNPKTWSVGELVTANNMNIHVRDNLLAVGPHLIARKTSDQSVTSSTALVDCTTMTLPVAANEVWQVEWVVRYEADTAGDMKLAFTFPTGGESNFDTVWVTAAGATSELTFSATTSPTASVAVFGDGAGIRHTLQIWGVFVNGANAGNVQLQFAQNTSNAVATIIKTHSTVWGVKLA